MEKPLNDSYLMADFSLAFVFSVFSCLVLVDSSGFPKILQKFFFFHFKPKEMVCPNNF